MSIYLYIAGPKYGETKCTSSEECGIRGGVCRSGLCVCSKGDDYISDDRTQCNRKNEIENMINILSTHIHLNTHARTHARAHSHTHAHARTHARTRAFTHTHARTHATTHARTHAHTHTHTHISPG